jgi:hypothetical protein
MVIWTVLDSCDIILDRIEGPGLAAPEILNSWHKERRQGTRFPTCRLGAAFPGAGPAQHSILIGLRWGVRPQPTAPMDVRVGQ